MRQKYSLPAIFLLGFLIIRLLGTILVGATLLISPENITSALVTFVLAIIFAVLYTSALIGIFRRKLWGAKIAALTALSEIILEVIISFFYGEGIRAYSSLVVSIIIGSLAVNILQRHQKPKKEIGKLSRSEIALLIFGFLIVFLPMQAILSTGIIMDAFLGAIGAMVGLLLVKIWRSR